MKKICLLLGFLLPGLCALAQNVGIGTPNPLSKLHVAGTIRSDTLIGVGVRSLFAAPNGRIYDSLVIPSTINWEINGNANIGPAQFLGTTNANDVIFKTNGTERARFLSTGNFGIGTPAPTAVIHSAGYTFKFGDTRDFNLNPTNRNMIESDGQDLKLIPPRDDTGTVVILDNNSVGGMAMENRGHGIINNYSNFATRTPWPLVLQMPATGFVGIGTITPGNKLEINSAVANSSGLRFTNLNSASPAVAGNGKSLSVNATGDVILVPSSGGNEWLLNGNAGTTAGTNFLGTTDAQDLVFKTNSAEHVRVLTTGQVGIGTAAPAPSAVLQIVSTTQGVLFPKLTTAQRQAIAAPAVGLMVYDVTANILMSYNGTRWQEVGGDPIGAIESFHKSMANTPALPWGWAECNGQVITDPESPYNGMAVPDLNNTRKFLRGDLTSGTMQAEDVGSHTHTGTTSTNGSHNHGGSTGSVNSTNGRLVPWDDNLASNKMNAANTGALGNTPAGGGGIPWDGLGTVGNFITTIDQLDHTHVINADGNHNHTFTTNANAGTENRPTNMSVVWIIRIK